MDETTELKIRKNVSFYNAIWNINVGLIMISQFIRLYFSDWLYIVAWSRFSQEL